ncbi:MAG: A/G-specific adenine glycosylase [Pseudomonadota bacterium]
MVDTPPQHKPHHDAFSRAMLAWYDREARRFPWRVPPGEARRASAYEVLVSEVMLQQTTTHVVEKRYPAFLKKFPTLEVLAAADEGAVTDAWAGLGYYRRARALHACAQAVVGEHQGAFPEGEAALKTLPGIGDYTGAAITAIAHGEPAVVVDGNIERVMARIGAIDEPLPKGKKAIKKLAESLMSWDRPGDYAQALMDLGARICRPKNPDCLLCPVREDCDAQALGIADRLPVKAPKKAKKTVSGRVFVAQNKAGHVLCVRRPKDGLFGAMLGLPGDGWDGSVAMDVAIEDCQLKGTVHHTLTHRELAIDVYLSGAPLTPGEWVAVDEAQGAMPTLFVKALERALS